MTSTNAASPASNLQSSSLSPGPGESQLTNRQLLRWMFRFLRPVTGYFSLAAFYLIAGILAEVLTTNQQGIALDQIKALHIKADIHIGFWKWLTGSDPQTAALRHVVLLLFLLVVANSAMRYLREVANSKFSMNMVFYIREAVYDQLQRVGFGFHDNLSSGQLINRALTDLQNVRAFVQTALLVTLEIVLVVGFYMILLATLNPYIALLAVIPLPIWTWYILRFSRKVQPAAKAAMEAGDRNIAILTENIAGVHVVKAFATEQQEISKYRESCDDFFHKTLYRIRLFANFKPIIDGVARATNLSLIFAVAVLVIFRKMHVGDYFVIQAAMQAILGRLQAVAQINDQYQSAIVSSRRLHEVLMAQPTVPDRPNALPLQAGVGNVRFENVTFGYDPTKPVLSDVTFEAKGGSVIAIVGPTGAGKTTLVNLIARFYEQQQGRILIDGIDLRDISLDSLRREVAFVFQETYLFSDTVEANIAYGRPHITGGEVEAAARLAQAHDFIETLPAGYQSILRERGSSLSGGQRQRLAIARALLTNPRIMVLDDATAAVDPETEGLIRRGMKFAMHGRTTFVIAHRLSTMRVADQVIVLEQGRITQSGTHEQLMKEPGHYRQIALAQSYVEQTDENESPSHMDRVRRAEAFAAEAVRGDADSATPLSAVHPAELEGK